MLAGRASPDDAVFILSVETVRPGHVKKSNDAGARRS
jgi:hypothetical protein